MGTGLLIFKERMIHRHLSVSYIKPTLHFLRDLLKRSLRHEIQPSIFIAPNKLGSKLQPFIGILCLIRQGSFKITYSSIGCKICRPLPPTSCGRSRRSLWKQTPIRIWTRNLSSALRARTQHPQILGSPVTLSQLHVIST